MEDFGRKYKEAFNMAVLEHKSDNEAVRESIERIFPQLKEPEDERIRKALISAINNICKFDEGLATFDGFSKGQVLAWLEKQEDKDSQVILPNILWHDGSEEPEELCEILCEWESKDAVWHDVAFYHADTKTFWNGGEKIEDVVRWVYVNEMFKKQGEQKPADKCEGCNNAKGCVACVDGSEWAHIEEQTLAWSEEDKERFKETLAIIETVEDINKAKDGFLGAKLWLKSLKDRVGCEVKFITKKEWSEEDEYNFAFIQEALLGLDGDDSYREKCCKMAEWLKFLKDRVGNFDDGYKVGFSAAKHNQWKPSDAQMASITCAVRKMKESACYDSELVSLYQDLKKLKEE